MTYQLTAQEREKELLLRQLMQHSSPTEVISNALLLNCIWESLTHLVNHHRNHKLVRTAVASFPDFIPRSFTIIALLYGAYSSQNNIASLSNDIVGLLDKDLKEEEVKIVTYSNTVQHPKFYPGLHTLWGSVNDLYSSVESDGLILPQTPHSAFSLLVLNHPELIGKSIEITELQKKLTELHEQLSVCLAIAEDSQMQGVAKH
jgi:hypothetical protein